MIPRYSKKSAPQHLARLFMLLTGFENEAQCMFALHFPHSKLTSLQTTARLEEGLKEDYSYNPEVEASLPLSK